VLKGVRGLKYILFNYISKLFKELLKKAWQKKTPTSSGIERDTQFHCLKNWTVIYKRF